MNEAAGTYSEVRIEAFTARVQAVLSNGMFREWGEEPQVDFLPDYVARGLIFGLRQKVWGQSVDHVIIPCPLDWKEALKERFAPAWVKRRRPVKYKRLLYEIVKLYPWLRMPEGLNDRECGYVAKQVSLERVRRDTG